MLKKRTIKEEDTKTGKVLGTTIRYDGRLSRVLQNNSTVLIMLDDEEVLNTPFKIPKGKELHINITISSILADSVEEK